MPWGYRAMFVLLHTYRVRHGCRTLREMISRYAPPMENHTENYIRAVAADTSTSMAVKIAMVMGSQYESSGFKPALNSKGLRHEQQGKGRVPLSASSQP